MTVYREIAEWRAAGRVRDATVEAFETSNPEPRIPPVSLISLESDICNYSRIADE
jgi:hypothetical protein